LKIIIPLSSALSVGMERFFYWLTIGFGSGLSPVAPGTVASLLGLVIFLLLPPLSVLPWFLLLSSLLVCGVYGSGRYSQGIGKGDPSEVVIDEIVAVLLVLAAMPASAAWWGAGVAFFRLFDIAKPWPIKRIEHLPGGWGIMLDDLAAAAYTVVILRFVYAAL
jgi:phosphatidylglycerophosphatase A